MRSAFGPPRLSPLHACLAALIVTQPVVAQTTTTPSAHFGANILPSDHPGYEVGIHLNRFTEFDKETNIDPMTGQPVRYNQIDRTYGFNLGAIAVTNRVPGLPGFQYRLTLQAGLTDDQPTEYLQNEIIHEFREIPHVPVGNAPTQFDAVVSAELTRWFGALDEARALMGAGVSLSTINQDMFVQAGLQTGTLSMAGHPVIRLSAITRGGAPAGSLTFEASEIVSVYGMVQGYGTSRIANSLSKGILPAVDLGLTYSSGFFSDPDDDPISELFWTIRLWWPCGFAFETWNDSLNDKDRGPTYGVRITTTLDSIPGLDRLFGIDPAG